MKSLRGKGKEWIIIRLGYVKVEEEEETEAGGEVR